MKPLARFLAILLLLIPASVRAAELAVHFFDVGQGDSALVVSPTGRTVLVDAGPPEAASALARRVRALVQGPIDLMVLTHPHADHLGGFRAVLGAVGARMFMDPGFEHGSPLYVELLHALETAHVPLKNAEAGRGVDLGGGASLEVLAPARPFVHGSRSDVNANGVVLRLTYGSTAFYLAADSEHPTERRILASGAPVRADVYKVAHHASRFSNSAELLARIAPTVAVVSVGLHNDYGHPHREVLDRLARRGVRVFRTDADGEVVATSDGTHVEAKALGAARVRAPPAAPGPVGARGATAADDRSFVADRRSSVFHRDDCPGAQSIKPHHRVVFSDRAQAIGAGRRPARDCNP